MIKRFFEWRQRQAPKTKLLPAYFFNVLVLMGVNLFLDKLWPDEEGKSLGTHFVKALFAAIFLTLFFDFNAVRAVFKTAEHERT